MKSIFFTLLSVLLIVNSIQSAEICDLCELAVPFVQNFAKNNQSLEEVVTILSNECNILPASFSGTCVSLVQTYVPVVFNMVDTDSPVQVCQLIKLCDSKQKITIKSKSAPAASALCGVCEVVYSFAEDILSNNVTDQQALEAIEQACDKIPFQPMAQGCTKFVSTEGETFINFIVANPNTTTACTTLGYCGASTTSGSSGSSGFISSSSGSSASGSSSSGSTSGTSSGSSSAASSGSSSGSSSAASSGSSSGSSAASSTSQSGITSAPPPTTSSGSSNSEATTSSSSSKMRL